MNPLVSHDLIVRMNEIAYELRRLMDDRTLTPSERAGYLRLRAFAITAIADDIEFRGVKNVERSE
jgi:hypothetical protein